MIQTLERPKGAARRTGGNPAGQAGQTMKSFLTRIEPFNRLPQNELERLASITQEVRHAKGEYIFSEGDEATTIWILRTGRIEILKYSSDGKPQAIESIAPGDLYGTLCRIGGSNTQAYPCTAVASVDSVSLRIQDGVFMGLFQRSPAFLTGVCALCSMRLSQMQDRSSMAQEPVVKRIARTLVDLAAKNGPTLMFTKREIAELAGTTVETSIRTLSAFEKKKWISSTRGQLTVVELEKLKALIAM